MFISVRSTDSGPWSSQSSQESHQPGQSLQSLQPGLFPALMPIERVQSAAVLATLSAIPASYISRPSGKLCPDSINSGIQIDEKGRRYISDGRSTFAIRYDRDHCTERVYQPQNPTTPGIPVRLNNYGKYERHNEVGLKGGAPGQVLRAQLNTMQVRRAIYVAEELQAQHALAAIDAEIQRHQHPGMNLPGRRQQIQQDLARVRNRIVGVDANLNGLRLEAQLLRQSMQNELTQLRRRRDDGWQVVHCVQRDINAVENAMRSGQAPPNAQNDLRGLHDALQQKRVENSNLDARILNVDREIGDIPQF